MYFSMNLILYFRWFSLNFEVCVFFRKLFWFLKNQKKNSQDFSHKTPPPKFFLKAQHVIEEEKMMEMSDYEKRRLETIKRNHAIMVELGLEKEKKKVRKRKETNKSHWQ